MISTVLIYEPSTGGAPVKGAPFFGAFDPYLNLAREEVLLNHLQEGEILLYLWQNQNTVVIGKNQNCFKECRVSLLEEEGGHLARRLSGGGAVFHDLGNLNYTFLARREDFDIARQTNVVLQAVKHFGIRAEVSGRNDITVEGKKFSGNAYYLTKGACYQHGTLLLAVDPEKIGRYLSVNREKLKAKGVASVRSRVTGLVDYAPSITVETMKETLMEAFAKEYGKAQRAGFTEDIENEAVILREKYASNSWKYGKTISFTYTMERRFSWGLTEIQLKVDEGIITQAAVFTDALSTKWPPVLQKALIGLQCQVKPLQELRKRWEKESILSPEDKEALIQSMDLIMESL